MERRPAGGGAPVLKVVPPHNLGFDQPYYVRTSTGVHFDPPYLCIRIFGVISPMIYILGQTSRNYMSITDLPFCQRASSDSSDLDVSILSSYRRAAFSKLVMRFGIRQ